LWHLDILLSLKGLELIQFKPVAIASPVA